MAHPAAEAAVAAAAPAPQSSSQFDSRLVPGIIGAELARHTAAVEDVLQEFKRTKAITRNQMRTLKVANAAIQRIGMYSQQITRLAGGKLRQSHEKLALDELTRRVIADNDWRYYELGLVIEQHLQPVEVIVDPGLLMTLLEVAVDCTARHGQAIQVSLQIKNWPEHGLLTLRAGQHVATAQTRPDADDESLEWVMLLQVAQAMGVMVVRQFIRDQVVITLEFTRTVKRLEGLTAIEVNSGSDSNIGGESTALAGHRVLLITGDAQLRGAVRDICEGMRLSLDVSPSVSQAVRYCEMDKPDVIMIDEMLRNAQFDELRGDLLRHEVNFPFIEIVTSSNVVEVASWMGDSMSRISRDALRGQLSSILAMEIAKVF